MFENIMLILEKAHIFAPSNKNNDNFRIPKITRISKLQPNNSDKTYLMETGGLTSPVSFFIAQIYTPNFDKTNSFSNLTHIEIKRFRKVFFILFITFHLQTDPNVTNTPKRIIKVNDIYVKVSDIYI